MTIQYRVQFLPKLLLSRLFVEGLSTWLHKSVLQHTNSDLGCFLSCIWICPSLSLLVGHRALWDLKKENIIIARLLRPINKTAYLYRVSLLIVPLLLKRVFERALITYHKMYGIHFYLLWSCWEKSDRFLASGTAENLKLNF